MEGNLGPSVKKQRTQSSKLAQVGEACAVQAD